MADGAGKKDSDSVEMKKGQYTSSKFFFANK